MIYESLKDQAGDIVGFRLAYTNRQAEEVTGFSSDGVAGQSLLKRLPAQDEIFAQYKQVVLTGETLFEEFSLGSGNDSKWFIRQVVAMPGGVAVTYRDITREKTSAS